MEQSTKSEQSTKQQTDGSQEDWLHNLRTLEPGYYFRQVPSEDVAKHWHYFGPLIVQALPSHIEASGEFVESNLLTNINSGRLVVWLAAEVKRGNQTRMIAIYSTYIGGEPMVGTKSLIIYTLTAVRGLDYPVLKRGLEHLRKYGKAHGCSQIVAYTGLLQFAKLGKLLGGKTSAVVSLEVE